MKKVALKTFIASIVTLFFLPCCSRSKPTNYSIIENKRDASLLETEAVFVFSFFSGNSRPVAQIIRIGYNNNVDTMIKPDINGNVTLKVKPGKYVFQFYNQDFYEIKTESIKIQPAHRAVVKVNFTLSEEPVVAKKPVIYVYPEKTKQIHVALDIKGTLDFTYPLYNNGWEFTADPDGTIHIDGKKYHYLFWEGMTNLNKNNINWNEGFIVDKKNLTSFFEKQLSKMGLQSNEIADFITYWCPSMSKNEKNYVHFLFNETYNEYAALHVNPTPDNIFRVFMLWSKADEQTNTQLKEQSIPSFTRKGFTVVEWGGTQLSVSK